MMASRRLAVVCAVVLLASATAGSPVTLTTKCPELCSDSIEHVFDVCARNLRYCKPRFCSGGARGVQCVPREETPEGDEIIVTPGGRVVIDKATVDDFYKFRVDLEAAAPVNTDLYLLSDATGSMSTAIRNAKSKFQNLVDEFKKKESDVRFGVGFFRDESELPFGFKNLESITSDTVKVKKAIDTLFASGGGDAPEANLAALYKVATESSIGWRGNSRKIVVYFGDVPGHEPTCVGGMTITRQTVIDALKAKEITVIGTSFGRGGLDNTPTRYKCSSGSAGSGQGSAIATATGGLLVPEARQDQLVEEIIKAIGNLPRTYSLDASECAGEGISSVTIPPLPITLNRGEAAKVDQTLTVKESVCDKKGKPFECRLRYKEGGAELPPTTVQVLEVVGCPYSYDSVAAT